MSEKSMFKWQAKDAVNPVTQQIQLEGFPFPPPPSLPLISKVVPVKRNCTRSLSPNPLDPRINRSWQQSTVTAAPSGGANFTRTTALPTGSDTPSSVTEVTSRSLSQQASPSGDQFRMALLKENACLTVQVSMLEQEKEDLSSKMSHLKWRCDYQRKEKERQNEVIDKLNAEKEALSFNSKMLERDLEAANEALKLEEAYRNWFKEELQLCQEKVKQLEKESQEKDSRLEKIQLEFEESLQKNLESKILTTVMKILKDNAAVVEKDVKAMVGDILSAVPSKRKITVSSDHHNQVSSPVSEGRAMEKREVQEKQEVSGEDDDELVDTCSPYKKCKRI